MNHTLTLAIRIASVSSLCLINTLITLTLTHSLTHSFIHSLTHSLSLLLTYLLTHSLTLSTEKMQQMGYNLRDIQESLNENKFDEICAAYILLGLQTESLSSSNPALSHSNLESGACSSSSTAIPSSLSQGGGDHSSHKPYTSSTTSRSSSVTPSGPPPGYTGGKKMSAPAVLPLQQTGKPRSHSMRQPSSTRRYAEMGQMPSNSNSQRRGTPEVVIQNGDRWEDEKEAPHSSSSSNKGRNLSPVPPKMGSAHNPNRAEMPKSSRKTSYDQVSEC